MCHLMLLIWLFDRFTDLTLFQTIINCLRALKSFEITTFNLLLLSYIQIWVMSPFIIEILWKSLSIVSRRTLVTRNTSFEIVHAFVKALPALIRTRQEIALMSRKLVSVLRAHFSASHEHSFVHFALFAKACIILESIHASFLENMVHNALFCICIHSSWWLWLIIFLYYIGIWLWAIDR